ncbi:hypothetical protein ACFE04_027626 [Oxalis oulophora]
MFPLQQGNQLWVDNIISSKTQHEQYKIPADLINIDNSLEDDQLGGKRKWGAMEKEDIIINNNNNNNNNNNINKKTLHRDVERQRRQQMATLYSTLRTLLPLEFIKGKRAISDHMKEAVRYIEHQRKKIEELSIKRDELKRLSKLRALSPERKNDSRIQNSLICVKVHKSIDGLQILISSSLADEVFPLSKVLQVLLQHGLDVASCVSSKANETLLQTIQTQVYDAPCLDLSQLQQKLVQAIS